jgi:hypothetical protein
MGVRDVVLGDHGFDCVIGGGGVDHIDVPSFLRELEYAPAPHGGLRSGLAFGRRARPGTTIGPIMVQDHWLHGFNLNVEEWDTSGQHYETLAICRQQAHAGAVFKAAIADKPVGKYMIRTRVVKWYPEGDW